MTSSGVKMMRDEFRADDYKYDPWGTAMSHAFPIAEVLYRLDENVPDAWEYRPGASVVRGEAPTYDEASGFGDREAILWADVESGAVNVADLVTWGNVLVRYASVADAAGRSY